MDNISEINRKIAENLIRCRKAAGMTQAELAEKINYSDKSVSKWESGNGVPDVYTLMQIAELFHVTINELVGDEAPMPKEERLRHQRKTKWLHTLITLLSSGIVWLVATCAYVVLSVAMPSTKGIELCFLYALIAQAIVIIVYAGIWKYRILGFVGVTLLIWMAIVCAYLTANLVAMGIGEESRSFWSFFLLGIPLQALEIVWVFFRSFFHRDRQTQQEKRSKKANKYRK